MYISSNWKICGLCLRAASILLLASSSAAIPLQSVPQALTPNPFGFNTSGIIELSGPEDRYISASGWMGVVSTDPFPAAYRRIPTANWSAIFALTFPLATGWSWVNSANPLSDNSLVLHTYDPEHGRSATPPCPTCVGAEFDLQYNPHAGDPTTNVHWIQVVMNNHSLSGGHGQPDNRIDNGASPGGRAPYYDDGGAAGLAGFYDFPVRSDDDLSHTWHAELFLVTGPAATAPGQITVWGGVDWGWVNSTPEPSVYILMTSGLVIMILFRRRLVRAPTSSQ